MKEKLPNCWICGRTPVEVADAIDVDEVSFYALDEENASTDEYQKIPQVCQVCSEIMMQVAVEETIGYIGDNIDWKGCEETFRHNHVDADFWLKDINELDPKELPQADVIIGSPPCTEFSRANRKKDPTVGFRLVDAFLGIVEAIEPDYWIMENVSNKELLDHVSDYPKMLVRCSDFGLRTMRKHLFCGRFPQPFSLGARDWRTQFPRVTTKDAYTQLKETDWKKRGIDKEDFTPEFMARVQTFPDSFNFFGSKTAKQKMTGNAVPPQMAFILATAIKEDFEEKTEVKS